MLLKKIPPVNIVLFFVMIGIVVAAIVGVKKYIDSEDDPRNNYVESSYNKSLSRYYTDSLSKSDLSFFGKIEILVYDSIELLKKPYVICRISDNGNEYDYNKVKPIAIAKLLEIFPLETWHGEFNYRISSGGTFRSFTSQLYSPGINMETELTFPEK